MPVSEPMLVVPSLKVAASKPNGFIPTSELIIELESAMHPSGTDAQILDNRRDTKFSQKVRNLVSHRSGARTMFARGLATYSKERKGIQITDAGRNFIS